jgi:hypothetical protein
MAQYEKQMNAHGVSEAIGFLLIFTMVIVGIGLVTLYGYPLLLEQQTNADEKIMEKNMIVLQNDVKGLTYKTVPYKETSLKIGGGSLLLYNSSYTPSTITITDGATPLMSPFQSGTLNYTSIGAQSEIALQNGAVVKRSTLVGGSVMLAQPRWFYDAPTNTMVVNLITFNSTDTLSRSGIGTVQMEMSGEPKYSSTTLGTNTFELQYTPDLYGTAWEDYFTRYAHQTSAAGVIPVTYQFNMPDDPDPTLVIKQYDVWIKAL